MMTVATGGTGGAGGTLVRRTVATPVGPLLLVAGPAGLRAVLWDGEDGSRTRRALRDPAASEGRGAGGAQAALRHLDAADHELAEYFAGVRRTFDVMLDPVGTPYQLRAWEVLRAIPFGATITYGEQARLMGDPRGARAVGAAVGRNPISVIVGCHRVLGARQSLTGFAGGLAAKAWLLAHEATVMAASVPASRALGIPQGSQAPEGRSPVLIRP